jgi:hypothetical protein
VAVRIPRSELVDLLASSLGAKKAEHVVSEAAGELELVDGELPLDVALSLLDKIAEEPGIVGISARFARARAVLRWTP